MSLGSSWDGNCIFKTQANTWEGDDCDDYHPFLCVDEEVLVQEQMTWEQALVHCRKKLFGGDTADDNKNDLASLPEEKYIVLDDEKMKAVTKEV